MALERFTPIASPGRLLFKYDGKIKLPDLWDLKIDTQHEVR